MVAQRHGPPRPAARSPLPGRAIRGSGSPGGAVGQPSRCITPVHHSGREPARTRLPNATAPTPGLQNMLRMRVARLPHCHSGIDWRA